MSKDTSVIRVAHVVGKLCAGGVESVVFNYYRFIDKEKIQFDFYYDADSIVDPPQNLIDMGARFIKVPPYQNIISYISSLRKYFIKEKYNIVHSHLNTLNVFPLFAAWSSNVPVRITHNHSTAAKGETKKNLIKGFLKPFAKVFPTHYMACSEYAGAWLFGKRFVSSGKVNILSNAIDLSQFKYNENIRRKVREKWKLKGKFVVGNVARFMFQKNHSFLIDIFKEIKKQRNDAVLLLVGDGPLRNNIENKVQKLGLQDSVRFVGIQDESSPYFQAMDVFVFPSRYEGLGMVAIEAQAVGVPCVASLEVPKDADVTNIIRHLPLEIGAKSWAEEVLRIKISGLRKEAHESVMKNGYDLKKEAASLLCYYRKLYLESVRGR